MAGTGNQKLKLLYTMQYLSRCSDEKHPVSVADIIDELEKHGIEAERKSVADDIEALRRFGMDIVSCRGRRGGCYVAQREFELPELKLLVDSVQASKLMTHKKTLSLIKKLEGLTSVYEARLLQRQLYVSGQPKSSNESVYYNIDAIYNAINGNRMIRFRYFEYTVGKECRIRRDGNYYELSPYALMCDNQNYYLLAYDSAAEQLRHYRVDKMMNISELDTFREGKDVFEKADMSSYAKRTFGMFTGETESVRVRFADRLAGAVIDRFGKDVVTVSEEDGHFIMKAEVAVSPQFFAWVFAFGADAEILSPENVREGMRAHAESVMQLYAPGSER